MPASMPVGTGPPCSSTGICSGGTGDTSPLCSSPMHQITRGISGLNTGGGGSISRGIPATCNEPLDLTMDVVTTFGPSGFYDMRQLGINQTVRLAPSPPTSPNNLCSIQEENGHTSVCTPSPPTPTLDYLHSHPQICLTDVQGSEITLVALSDSSHDSEDSLEGNNSKTTTSFQGLLITEPSSDMPSITRGVGRKTSLENETSKHESKLETDVDTYARRGSDKSLGFSDDSLSNDSNLSPCGPEPSGSSGFHSHSEFESRLSPDSLSDRRLSDEYYELPLPYDCSNMESSHILEIVKKTIDSKMPPKGFSEATASTSSVDASNLNIEYSSGLQVELQVFEGRTKENKGIKLRRISGDQLEYGKLCQQLITSLTVN
uniref:non-specific serine/threonine protein kinase n=2 Tax=Culicoides sonorensis TaxID=179676 RepID=A0A336MN49_CULSO